MGDYHSLLQRLREARKPTIVTGILPRRWATNEWYSRALGLNSRVRELCRDMRLKFVDAWAMFYGRNRYYSSGDLHLSDEGARALGSVYQQTSARETASDGELGIQHVARSIRGNDQGQSM